MNTTSTAGRAALTARSKRDVRGPRGVRWLVDDVPSPEEARRRILSAPSYFSTLSPEARAMILRGEGPDFLGPRNGPKRRPEDRAAPA